MREILPVIGDTKASEHPGINSFIRGQSNLLMSSIGLGWKDIAIEFHDAYAGMKEESISSDHLIALFADRVTRGEVATSKGRFVTRAFEHGAMNLFPAGPIPACRLFTPAKLMVCALTSDFVNDVSKELETIPVIESRHTFDLHDHILRGTVLLLSAEVNAGGVTGKLYADHLAHALAIRYLWLV
jgi:AraC family transcriptional regulator